MEAMDRGLEPSKRVPAEILIAIERGEPPLLAIRSHFGLSERECAKLAGVSRAELASSEEGRSSCDRSAIRNLSRALGIRSNQLVYQFPHGG